MLGILKGNHSCGETSCLIYLKVFFNYLFSVKPLLWVVQSQVSNFPKQKVSILTIETCFDQNFYFALKILFV